ncbi:hypothetical protein CHS0354_018307 [Potamilus streckersoni]|uniref:Uncharacterized protein n=1 Tax=Potamilus streckersoni TaxID=2493646 RepID=A0AAE0TKF4_9BIVA|nr:hypothetical protein CHS0354_018307 [Potamilus streckersoni]
MKEFRRAWYVKYQNDIESESKNAISKQQNGARGKRDKATTMYTTSYQVRSEKGEILTVIIYSTQ